MRRSRKFALSFFVFASATILIFWNTAAQESATTIGVAEAKRNAPELLGQTLQVRGAVVDGSIVQNGTVVESFAVEDAEEQLLVTFGLVPPDGFGPKDVVIEGVLTQSAEGLVVLEAVSIHVGCASKY